jgi:GT2 family glycosyltransferase
VEPELAVAVLGYRREPGLVAAVTSLLRQEIPVELVVVSSGGGGAAEALRRAGHGAVPVIERDERLFAGAARNLGIGATRAPWVAFLAADCVAEPGWVRARLEAHRGGALAVASAITNADPESRVAWAAYMNEFHRRMPGARPGEVLLYGVSYARALFDRFGLFREDLCSGEDTEYNERLARRGVEIRWAPEVRTAHRHPTTLAALLADGYRRGRRQMRAWRRLGGPRPARVLVSTVANVPRAAARSLRAAGPGERLRMVAAAPLLLPLGLAGAGGALAGALRPAGPPDDVPRPEEPRILALLAFRDELRHLPGWFASVAPQVDGIVALDDGSTDGSGEYVAAQPGVLRLVRLPPRQPHDWDEPRKRRLLVDAAHDFAPDWLLAVDADERLERDFRRRAIAEIHRLGRRDSAVLSVVIRELWDAPDTYRVDGLWGRKRRVSFWRARPDHEVDPRPLHGHWAPLNSVRGRRIPAADLVVYHLKMIEREARLARRDRYNDLDPGRRSQAMGYDYLTDETGQRLERLPRGREY